jgi:hypothetical protein
MSRRSLVCVLGGCLALALGFGVNTATTARAAGPDWAANMTVIEACSCPMFCQCYFNTKPASDGGHAGHAGKHFCRANNAYKINAGHYGATKLDGTKFWIAADLGDDFSDGEMDWGVLYFDKPLTPPQREAIQTIVGHLFPVKWRSLTTAEGSIDKWEFTKDGAHALLDGGRTGEVKLKAFPGMGGAPVVMKNLPYWGAPRNEGFVMMPNEVEAYRVGPNAFEFKGTNGFMLTVDITSKDIQPKAASN